MAKQIILIILLTVAAVFFRSQLSHVLDGLVYVHNGIAGTLARIFSGNETGRLIQDIIALLVIPLVVGGVIGATFWLIKHEMLPNVMIIIWVVWLVLLTTMIAQHGMHKSNAAGKQGSNQITEQEQLPPAEQAVPSAAASE